MLTKHLIVFAVCVTLYVEYSRAEGECIICDSRSDLNCAQRPEKIAPQKCTSQRNVTTCYVRIVDGHTLRGCFRELDEDVQRQCADDNMGMNCTFCENLNTSKDCNNIIFPAHRMTCHDCSGDLKSKCFGAPEEIAIPCKVSNAEDKCYIRKTSNGIERGCLSGTSKCSNVSHCSICDGEGCNNLAGNNPNVPTDPSSATAWASTMTIVFIAVVVSFKV